MRIVPGAALPLAPASTASAGTSTDVPPLESIAVWVVWNRTSDSVMHTLPAGIVKSAVGAVCAENRSVPTALVAFVRLSPRMAACLSR